MNVEAARCLVKRSRVLARCASSQWCAQCVSTVPMSNSPTFFSPICRRVLDLFRRLSCEDAEFSHLPHDTEVTLAEVEVACRAASRWRGPRGERRRVRVAAVADGGGEAEGALDEVGIWQYPEPAAGWRGEGEGEAASAPPKLVRCFVRMRDGRVEEIDRKAA